VGEKEKGREGMERRDILISCPGKQSSGRREFAALSRATYRLVYIEMALSLVFDSSRICVSDMQKRESCPLHQSRHNTKYQDTT